MSSGLYLVFGVLFIILVFFVLVAWSYYWKLKLVRHIQKMQDELPLFEWLTIEECVAFGYDQDLTQWAVYSMYLSGNVEVDFQVEIQVWAVNQEMFYAVLTSLEKELIVSKNTSDIYRFQLIKRYPKNKRKRFGVEIPEFLAIPRPGFVAAH